jgi:(2Fe-2S) ferredoxin
LKAEVKRRGLTPLVRANKSGCLDQCELGPTVVIYPQAIWYGGVTLADVPRIIEQTVLQGKVLDDLQIPGRLLNTKGGTVAPNQSAAEASGGTGS